MISFHGPPPRPHTTCERSAFQSDIRWWQEVAFPDGIIRGKRYNARPMCTPIHQRQCVLLAVVLMTACGGHPEAPGTTEYDQVQAPLQAHCDVIVKGQGTFDIENEYLPGVVQCENGSAPLEALKVQAVAARSFLYYKIQTNSGKAYDVEDGTQDQVFSCGAAPSQKHYDAVALTSGQILRYNNTQHCAFYVAGAKPSTEECVPVPGDNDWSNTEKFVTYNWGKSGSQVTQTTLGWVNAGNDANRGCMSQNGSACLAGHGWNYQDMLRFYYGMDIQFVTAQGSCVDPASCAPHCSGTAVIDETCNMVVDCAQQGQVCKEMADGPTCVAGSNCQCNPGETLSQACGFCGKEIQTCGDDCQWQGWTPCTSQGACNPGAIHVESCGDCGLRASTCSNACTWEAFGTCVPYVDGQSCATGLNGGCAQGVVACQEGVATCQPSVDVGQEICDGVDNDCDGQVDENATVLGTNVPWAAMLNAADVPDSVWYGDTQLITVSFENVGTETWPAGQVYLVAQGPGGNASSLLQATSWLDGHNVAASGTDTYPGETAVFSFDVQVPADAGAVTLRCPDCMTNGGVRIAEQFQLTSVGVGAIRCPEAVLSVDLVVDDATDGSSRQGQRPPPSPGTVGGGCALSPAQSTTGWPWLGVFVLGIVAFARRRILHHP